MNTLCSKSNYSSEEANAVLTVGYSFRCGVLACYSSQEALWSYAWQRLAKLSKNQETADFLLNRLSTFVENVLSSSSRNIHILPHGCPGLCRDECLAVSVIVASQIGPCPALKACAYALLENSHMEACLDAASSFGTALQEAEFPLTKTILDDGLKLTFSHNDQKIFHA